MERKRRRSVTTAISFCFIASISDDNRTVCRSGSFAVPQVLAMIRRARQRLSALFSSELSGMGYNMELAENPAGMEDNNASLLFLIVSCAVNIVLDLVFVAGLGMDVAGAAWAFHSHVLLLAVQHRNLYRKKYPSFASPICHRMNKQTDAGGVLAGDRASFGIKQLHLFSRHILMQSLISLQGSIFIAACSWAAGLRGLPTLCDGALPVFSRYDIFPVRIWGSGGELPMCI